VAFTDFENALNSTSGIELTTTGRVSGRETSRPVWFVRRGEKLYLLPVTGTRFGERIGQAAAASFRCAACGEMIGVIKVATEVIWARSTLRS